MPLMTNAEAFRYDFGIYATELWAMTEEQFLEWLNAECDRERPRDMVVRCKDCKYYWKNSKYKSNTEDMDDLMMCLASPEDDAFCSEGERKDDENMR